MRFQAFLHQLRMNRDALPMDSSNRLPLSCCDVCFGVTVSLIGWLPARCDADTFAPGNLLVANGSTVTEYTMAGETVQVIDIEPHGGHTSVLARDVVVDRFGRMHVMTFSPGVFMATEQAYLSTFDPASHTWQHHTIDGWSLSGTTYYGGISVNDDYLYAPDLQTGGGDGDGIIRFPLSDLSAPERFHEVPGSGYNLWHTIKVGLDGYVYALERGPIPGDVDELRRFDPVSMEELASFSVHHGASVMSVAVAADGEIFTVDIDGDIHRHDADGVLLETMENVVGGVDMELAPDGTIVVGSDRVPGPPGSTGAIVHGATVKLTDPSFGSFSTFDVPYGVGPFDVNFVAFISPVPEPPTMALAATGLLTLLALLWRKPNRLAYLAKLARSESLRPPVSSSTDAP